MPNNDDGDSPEAVKHVVEATHNTGRCGTGEPLHDWALCCRQYHHCGFKLDREVLADAYDGYCFTELTWECPRCGWANRIRYKVRDTATGGDRTGWSQTPGTKHSGYERSEYYPPLSDSSDALDSATTNPTCAQSASYSSSDDLLNEYSDPVGDHA